MRTKMKDKKNKTRHSGSNYVNKDIEYEISKKNLTLKYDRSYESKVRKIAKDLNY